MQGRGRARQAVADRDRAGDDASSTAPNDILLATNIIESGLDIPRVNTLIDASRRHVGLRSSTAARRVGRSKVRAYAYLTVRPTAC